MFVTMEFTRGKWIGPALEFNWPEDRTTPLYWEAGTDFELPGRPESVRLAVAADRHYEVFVNGHRAGRRRNFYNGDEYVFAQTWSDEVRALLRPGRNRLEVVVRSDPWRNKNHRCFRPALALEAELVCGSKTIALGSDSSWELGVIEGWRSLRALAGIGTIHFETVSVPAVGEAMLAGFSNRMVRRVDTAAIDPPKRVFAWDDPPERVDVHQPKKIVASGLCGWANQGLRFELEGQTLPAVLETRFEDAGGRAIEVAGSALVAYRVELNGEVVFEHRNLPDRHQMGLPDYLQPAGRGTTRPGTNTLRITVLDTPSYVREFRLASRGAAALENKDRWTPSPQDFELELSEGIGAMFTAGGSRPFCVHDFGGVVTGRLELSGRAEAPSRIYLVYGLTHRAGRLDCHRMNLRAVDVLEVGVGAFRYEAFDVRTFRYLTIVVEGGAGLDSIQAAEPVFLDETRSELETSDTELDALWRASRRTAQLCSTEIFMDNPEREHAQWVDCTAAVSSAGYYAFGQYRRPGKALEEFALTQQPDGQTAGYAPGLWFPRLPLQCHMSLFAMQVHRHFMHTGDEAFGRRMLDVVLRMIEHWERHRTREGLIADLHTLFVDWGSHLYSYGAGSRGPTGALTAMNAYYLGTLKSATAMAGFLGRNTTARELGEIYEEVRRSMRRDLFDPGVGLFRDGAGHPGPEANYSQTANALAVLYGAATEGRERTILTKAFDPPPELEIIPANAHFVRQAGEALFETGCDELAVRWLRAGFGPMLAKGPGTLWETFHIHASLCQATGAGVAYLMARYLAGLYPAEPGYRVIGLDPHPAGPDSLRARLTTPFGPVNVAWERHGDDLDCRLDLPEALQTRPIRAGSKVRLKSEK